MKIGMSSYSLAGDIHSGKMTILDVMEWTKEQGGEHIEIVPIGYTLTDNPSLVEDIVKKSKELDLCLSNYAIGADFLTGNKEEYQKEIDRVKKEVDIANALGVKKMRHDISFKPPSEGNIEQFDCDLSQMIEACQEIADYAKQYNIVTSIENHGFYVQGSDRVRLIIKKVNRPNFGLTLDTGNFLCVDEDPLCAIKKCLEFTTMLHVKDFYIRDATSFSPGQGWFTTTGGKYLRGAITGHGDIDIKAVMQAVKESGYDGDVSIEFEGMEPCKLASQISLQNVRNIIEQL